MSSDLQNIKIILSLDQPYLSLQTRIENARIKVAKLARNTGKF